MRSIERRIEALENSSKVKNKPWVRIICEEGEGPEEAAERLGIDLDDEEKNYIIRIIINPGDQ
jgi:hypothetical protein